MDAQLVGDRVAAAVALRRKLIDFAVYEHVRIVNGEGRPEDLDRLDLVASKIEGRTICALGDAAAMPVRSFVRHFRHEFAHYIEHGHSILEAKGQSAAA